MRKQQTIRIAKFAVVVAVPVVLWAYAEGPDAHNTGVPAPGNAELTCARASCHIGTQVNGGGGTLNVTASGGSTYTPGQKQTITIQATDSAARVFGFEMTARLASDLNQQAGTFTPTSNQQVLCAAPTLNDLGDSRRGASCGSNRPIEFIEHSRPFNTGTITVDWTPPATASGDIALYVSVNAANGNTAADPGDHIYNTHITLSAASAGGVKPATSAAGITRAAQFGVKAGFIAPGTWLEIYGDNLSSTTREWTGNDFKGTTAPTSLDGVSVTIANKPAFVRFISPGQINVQAPDDIGTGPVPVVVTVNGVASDPVTVTATAAAPGLLAPISAGGKQYVAAYNGATLVGNPSSATVKPGDVITLYGIGFGPVTPAMPAGQIVGTLNNVTNPLKVRIGGSDAAASYQGLGPNFVGLYQFNITVPNVPDGDQPVTIDLGGIDAGQTIFITVKR